MYVLFENVENTENRVGKTNIKRSSGDKKKKESLSSRRKSAEQKQIKMTKTQLNVKTRRRRIKWNMKHKNIQAVIKSELNERRCMFARWGVDMGGSLTSHPPNLLEISWKCSFLPRCVTAPLLTSASSVSLYCSLAPREPVTSSSVILHSVTVKMVWSNIWSHLVSRPGRVFESCTFR